MRNGRCKGTYFELSTPVLDGDGHRWQQRDPDAVRDHLHESAEARCAQIGFARSHFRTESEGLGAKAMTVVEQENLVALELAHLETLFPSERVSVRKGDDEGIFTDDGVRKMATEVGHEHEDACVDLAFAQLRKDVFGFLLSKRESEFGIRCSSRRRDLGQQVRRNGGNDADAKCSLEGIALAPGGIEKISELDEDATRTHHDLLACGCHEDAAMIALEESDAEDVFELLDLCAESWLGDVTLSSCAVESERIGDSRHVLKLAD